MIEWKQLRALFEPSKSKCGCAFGGVVGLPFWYQSHDVYIHDGDEERKGRYRKIVCKSTGAWWKVPLPDLHEIV